MAPSQDERLVNKVNIGTMGWSYKFWVGNFYPERTKSTDYLAEYAKHFNTVEVNNTFYRIPSTESLKTWFAATPTEFHFSAKFPQVISHRKMLENCENELRLFLERIWMLGGKLGPLLLQLPPTFGPDRIVILKDFLSKLPQGRLYAVEVRNREILTERLYSILRDNDVALTLSTNPAIPETEQITADFVYIRWEGDRRKVNGMLGRMETDRTQDIEKWGSKIVRILEKAKQVFGYFSKYYSGHPPTDVKVLLKSIDDSERGVSVTAKD